MSLIDNPRGGYRFLTGIAPYSSGVLAAPGYEIVRVTLCAPLPYRSGFELIERYLAEQGRPRAALCAVELRAPGPWSFEGFAGFNADYQRLLAEWICCSTGATRSRARMSCRKWPHPHSRRCMHFRTACRSAAPDLPLTFVIAGAGELPEGVLSAEAIVRGGEVTAAAIEAKATFVMGLMRGRLTGLGAAWADVTAVDLYTLHSPEPFLANVILEALGPAAIHGVHWHYSRPPIAGLEFEMDMRGVRRELWI